MTRHAPSIGIGIGISLRSQFPSFSGLLNAFPGAAAAYSLRRLGSYGGPVVKVRRTSFGGGPAEADFTAPQIDSGAMLSFVTEFSGTADGLVSTWYDQSGQSNNATQGTNTAQPKIVSAGSQVVGGLDFDGVDDFMKSGSNTTHDSVFMVATRSSVTTATLFGSTFGNSKYSFLSTSAGTSFSAGQSTISYADALDMSIHLHTTLHSAGKMRKDGTEKVSGTLGVNSSGDSLIGARHLSSVPATFWVGPIAEVIVYPDDQTANVSGIETNMQTAYPSLP